MEVKNNRSKRYQAQNHSNRKVFVQLTRWDVISRCSKHSLQGVTLRAKFNQWRALRRETTTAMILSRQCHFNVGQRGKSPNISYDKFRKMKNRHLKAYTECFTGQLISHNNTKNLFAKLIIVVHKIAQKVLFKVWKFLLIVIYSPPCKFP